MSAFRFNEIARSGSARSGFFSTPHGDVETPAWVCFSCRDGAAICDGTAIEDACALFAEHPRVLAIGVNCTPPRHVTSLIRKIRTAAPEKAVVVYPNSGESYVAADNRWVGIAGAGDIGALAEEWYAAGARIIGGCCQIGPARIRTLANALARFS